MDAIGDAADRAVHLIRDEGLTVGMAVAVAAAEQNLDNDQAMDVVIRLHARVKHHRELWARIMGD